MGDREAAYKLWLKASGLSTRYGAEETCGLESFYLTGKELRDAFDAGWAAAKADP